MSPLTSVSFLGSFASVSVIVLTISGSGDMTDYESLFVKETAYDTKV